MFGPVRGHHDISQTGLNVAAQSRGLSHGMPFPSDESGSVHSNGRPSARQQSQPKPTVAALTPGVDDPVVAVLGGAVFAEGIAVVLNRFVDVSQARRNDRMLTSSHQPHAGPAHAEERMLDPGRVAIPRPVVTDARRSVADFVIPSSRHSVGGCTDPLGPAEPGAADSNARAE